MIRLTKQDLEKCPTVVLVVLCGRVADDPDHFTKLRAGEALELKKEWASLQTPPEPSLKEEQKKKAKLSLLHERMASFLAGIW